jgi:hypothetical protein
MEPGERHHQQADRTQAEPDAQGGYDRLDDLASEPSCFATL